jgi:putative ABC transport system permease protein
MIAGELCRSAFRSLAGNRLRTFLTMLGIVIGVGSVVAMISLGEGARSRVTSSIQSMGTNLLTVQPGAPQRGPVSGGAVETLIRADADAIAALPGVRAVAPEASQSAQVKFLAANTNVRIIGTTPDYASVRAYEVARGAFLTAADVRGRRRVAVLGADVAAELFNALDPVGERIQIKGQAFTVIGVLIAKGSTGPSNPDEQVVIPISAFQGGLFGGKALSSIGVAVGDNGAMEKVQAEIERLLRARHRIRAGAANDFNVRSQTEMLETMNSITGIMTALLGGIAAVSLIVGGIGIMNIMLVSVRERTREIGIRKAVGARGSDILQQFLFESIVVSAAGGAVGLSLGYGLAMIIARIGGWDTVVPLYAVVLAVATSIGIGVIFGVWPAREAARLAPVDALRYE